MDWNTIQQLIRVLAQFAGGVLVSNGYLTEDLATSGVGAVMSIAAIVWWVFWDSKRKLDNV
jgi:hypothetical protein